MLVWHILLISNNFDVRLVQWITPTRNTPKSLRLCVTQSVWQSSPSFGAARSALAFLMDQLGMAQSAVSYHMKILCESGIVVSRQEGKWTHYSLSSTGSKAAVELLLSLTTPSTEQDRCCG